MGKRILLLADVHLSDATTEKNDRFIKFLDDICATQVSALYILGDLFDVWLGDDAPSEIATPVQHALKELSHRGIPVFIQHGNRDFMLGMRFANACGVNLLPTAYVLQTANCRWLLMHGDSLVADSAYLRYRCFIRNPLVVALAGCLPLSWRQTLAKKMRAASKGDVITAVIDATRAEKVLRQYGCQRLLHGHLHQAQNVQWKVGGRAYQRWCLPAWDNGTGYAEIEDDKLQLVEGR